MFSAALFYALILQAIGGVMSLAIKSHQEASQAPQHFTSFDMKDTSKSDFGESFIDMEMWREVYPKVMVRKGDLALMWVVF